MVNTVSSVSAQAPQTTLFPFQWVSKEGIFPQGQSGNSLKLTTHNHLEPNFKMEGTIYPCQGILRGQ
jgi:uncharacterized protein (DUF3820 family)